MLTKKILFILSFVFAFSVLANATNDANRDKVLNKLNKKIKFEFSDSRKFQGKITSTIEHETVVYQEWENNDWVNVEREILTTNFTEGSVENIYQEYINNEWVNESKSILEFEFDASDSSFRFLEVLSFSWNADNNVWDSQGRSVYNYDSNNFLTSIDQFFNLGGQELLFSLVEYTNNSAGNPLEELVKRLDFGTMQLVEDEKTVYVYDSGNANYLQIETEFIFENGVFVEDYRTTYTRNSLLNPLTEIYEYYDNGAFHNGGKTEITYLANNDDVSLVLHYGHDGANYTNSSRETYTYTSFGEVDIYTYETYTNNNYNPWLKTIYTYDDQNREIVALTQEFMNGNIESADYQNAFRDLTSYEATSIKDEYLSIKGFQLNNNYPNPFNPSTTISYQISEQNHVKLSVYDILGNEVAVLVNKEQAAGEYQIPFSGAELSSGVYFYQIQIGSLFETKKMILNK